MGTLCQIKKKLKTLGLHTEESTNAAWRIVNHINSLVKNATNQEKERRLGKPRTDEERKKEHLKKYGTTELPPRGTEVLAEKLKDVKNMSWEKCLDVAKKSGMSDPEAFCGWMKKQGKVT